MTSNNPAVDLSIPAPVHEYGRCHCRVCGEYVFVDLSMRQGADGDGDSNLFEMSCSKGHTDQYERALIDAWSSDKAPRLKTLRAYAGMG